MYTIGDFLIKIQNAYMARKKQMDYPVSKTVVAIGKILEKEGYVGKIKSHKSDVNGRDELVIELKYDNKMPAISSIKLVSKPSVHRYTNKAKVSRAASRHGIAIVSTSQGIMTNREAQKKGVGGEVICQIY